MDANIYHRSMLEKYNEPLLSKANRTKFECMVNLSPVSHNIILDKWAMDIWLIDWYCIMQHFDTNIMDAWGNDINVHKALHVRKVGVIC